jgi:hypothetical protein
MNRYTKLESGRAQNSRPLGTDEMLARETERLRRVLPAELGALKSTNSFSVIGAQVSDRHAPKAGAYALGVMEIRIS